MGAPTLRSPLFHFIARHLALLLVLSSVAIPLAAQSPPASSTPRVVVVFNLRSNEMMTAAAQSPPKNSEINPRAATLGGSWRLTPLMMKGAEAPETGGQFQEFGETYHLENALVFWARFGPSDKDWGLFSLKNGKSTKILVEDVEFLAPDSRKLKIHRAGLSPNSSLALSKSTTLFHVGKRLLYISHSNPDHLYAWDGERLICVLCAGDELEVGGVRYTVKRATVLDVGPDGRALIYYDANKPQHINGWVLHDASGFTPLWKEGDSLPGMPAVQIKNLSAGHFCAFKCVGGPRLLEDGSVLAPLEVTGAPYKTALFHIGQNKAEKIIAEKADEPGVPRVERLGDLLAARGDSFVLDVSESGTVTTYEGSRIQITYYLKPALLFYQQGKFRQVSPNMGGRERVAWGGRAAGFAFDSGIFLAPESSHLLITLVVTGSKSRVGLIKNKMTATSFPGLYFWDGETLSPVPWETALGMDVPTALKSLESTPVHYWTFTAAKTIALRRIGGPASGVGIGLPIGGSVGARWFVASNSAAGALERPQFNVAGRTVSAADVVAWKGPEEAVLQLDDGFFLLTQAVPPK
jgi:hypothetical protein